MSISPTSRDVVLAGLVLYLESLLLARLIAPQTERTPYHRLERATRDS